jgi:hypothetical protein
MVVGKVVAHLCPTLNIFKLKFSVEHDRVVSVFLFYKGSSLSCDGQFLHHRFFDGLLIF